MKIATVVGARPQFIKAAALSRVLRKEHDECIIHTGQHYDHSMSQVFFDELSIPYPDYNLGISGGSHGKMTGSMLISIEDILQQTRPDMVLVYGDTNSTLAGALAAVKMHLPVCHVEAGVRMGTLTNPEEVNRVLTDRIASFLFCCTETAITNLAVEGITNRVYNTGDLMYDTLLFFRGRISLPKYGDILDLNGNHLELPSSFYLMTCHREENTGTDVPLLNILEAMNSLDVPVIYPVHPRNHLIVDSLCKRRSFTNIKVCQPVGYLTSLYLIKNAKKIVTDSGGLQREAWFFNRQCVTILDNPVWPETLHGNMNQLCKPNTSEILEKLAVVPSYVKNYNPFGDGHAAEKITEIITAFCKD